MCKGIEVIQMMCASAKVFINYDPAFKLDEDETKMTVSSPLFSEMTLEDKKFLGEIGWIAENDITWINPSLS